MPPTITRTFKARLLQLTVLLSSKNLVNSSPAYPEFSCSCHCCSSQVFDPDQILKSLHWLKIQERIEYKIISTTYKVLRPVHTTFSISLPSSLPDPLGRRHWSLSFTHKLSRVSKSLTALFGMRHLNYGTNFLHLFAFLVSRPPQSVLSSIARLRLCS